MEYDNSLKKHWQKQIDILSFAAITITFTNGLIMKKTFLLAAGAVLLAAAVSAFAYVKNESNSMDELFEANVEALTQNEGGIPTLPCVQAVSVCNYLVKDASGNIYNASSTGLRNI